jgi:hypothetical protein
MTPAPTKCPCCDGRITLHVPESSKDYEAWEFDCGAELIRLENGNLTYETGCSEVMARAIRAMNSIVTTTLVTK